MNKKIIRIAVIMLVAVAYVFAANGLLAQDNTEKEAAYIGAKKCKICHKGEKNGMIWEIWEKSAHANALKTLEEKGEDKNPECLACHTTGYGKGGYGEEVPEGKKELDLASVGCEACHGEGSLYKKKKVMEDHEASLAAGLIIPDEKTCRGCHNEKSPEYKEFDFKKYWAKIAHSLPPEEEDTGTEE